MFWSGIDNVGLTIVKIIISIILARLLSPADFGLMAMISIFIAVAESLVQGGFGSALIRKAYITQIDYSTTFIFNLITSFSLYALLFFSSPLIASFFNQPNLDILTKVVAFVFVIHSFGYIQQVILRKSLAFKKLAIINVFSSVTGGFAGIGMALAGFGVWSLVAQLLTKACTASLMFWRLGSWKMDLSWDKQSFKENFTFGYKLTLAQIINSIAFNAYNLVIGKIYNVSILGTYYQAKKLSEMPTSVIRSVFYSVSFPVLSSVQQDDKRLIKIYLQLMRSAAFITFPVMILLSVIARPLILVLLTEKWLDSIQYFQILCFSGMLLPLMGITVNIPLIKGRSDVVLKLEIFFKAQMIFFLFITAFMGLKAMIFGILVQVLVQFLVNLVYVSRFLNISFIKQLANIFDLFFISCIAAGITYLLKYMITNSVILLVSQSTLFVSIYIIINYIYKAQEIIEIRKIYKGIIRKKYEALRSI